MQKVNQGGGTGENREDLGNVFLYNMGDSESLVMLHTPEKVFEKMMQPPHQSIIIWIIDPIPQNLIPKLTQFQTETNSKIFPVPSPNKAHQHLLKNKQKKNIVLICQPELTKSIKFLNRLRQISTIIQYPAQMKDSDEEEEQGDMGQGIMVIQSEDQGMLLKDLRMCCYVRPTYRELMNFVTLRDGVQKSHFLVKTLMAMLNQNIGADIRQQILVCFQKLLTQIDKNKSFPELILQLKKGPLSIQRALYWYTHQIGIYKIVNNLLRSTSHPCQTFYLQPLFKDIFLAIEALHKKEKKQNFICFRGGHLYKDQAEELQANVGQIVKNLSFLSTSRDRETALGFVKNTFFEIVVEGLADAGEQNLDYGYANVKKYSYFSQEQQIIFNPLCSFKILQIQQTQPNQQEPLQYLIKLEYGSLTKLALKNKSNKKLTEHENCLYTLGKIWKQDYSNIQIQGQVLSDRSECLEGALEYWSKYGEIGHELKWKCTALVNYGQVLKNKGKCNQYLQTVKKAEQVFLTTYPNFLSQLPDPKTTSLPTSKLNNICIYATIQQGVADALTILGKYNDALHVCTHFIEPVLGYFSQKKPQYYQALGVLGNCYFFMMKFEKSEEFYRKLLEYYLIKYGEFHPSRVAILINQAVIDIKAGNFQNSEKTLQQSVRILMTIVGENHPEYLRCLQNMVSSYYSQKLFQKAYDLGEKYCQLVAKVFGEYHHFYLNILTTLADILLDVGDLQKAEEFFHRYFSLYENSHQQANQYAMALRKFSLIHLLRKNPSQFLKMQRKSYKLTLKIFGQDNKQSIKALRSLILALISVQKVQEAEHLFQSCLEKKLDKIIQEDPQEIRGLYYFGFLLNYRKQYQRSLRVFQKAAQLSLQALGQSSLMYIYSLCLSSIILTQMGQHQTAVKTLQQCCAQTPKIPQITDPQYFDYISSICTQLSLYNKFYLGIETITKSYQRVVEIFGPKHPYYCGFYAEMLVKLRFGLGCCQDVLGEVLGGGIGWGGMGFLKFCCDVMLSLGKYRDCINKAISLYKQAKTQNNKTHLNFALKTILQIQLKLNLPKKSKKLLQLLTPTATTNKKTKPKKDPNKNLKKSINMKTKKLRLTYCYLDFN